jgi:hypothetical protein
MWSQLKWDLLLVGVLVAGVLGYTAIREPYVGGAEETRTDGSRPPDRTEGDVLLLLPDSPAAPAEQFGALDCSYGWYNSLWQRFGSFATALARNLSPEFLAGRNVVIVPRRVARAMPSNGISALASFARDGGQVVLEQPGDGWERLTGISTSGDTRPARHISSVAGLGVHGRLRTHLPEVPLAGGLRPSPALDPWPEGNALLDVDGQPGLTANELGDGIVYTFLFEFGCTVTALQQGEPDEKMRFVPDEKPSLQPTARRVADEKMLQANVPYADLLEQAVFRRLAEFRPLPRLWPYPGSHAGAILQTHPTPEQLRPALGYLDYARRQEERSTLLVAEDRISSTELGIVRQTGADLGMLWVRGLERPPATETVGLGALRPYARELSLQEQKSHFDSLLGDNSDVRLLRTEGATHFDNWSRTFEQIAAADFRVDVSFGPTEADQHGYLFGTGFPFYPVDDRGLPFPVLEQPFVLEGPNLDRDRLRQMLDASRDFFHQSLAVSIPAEAMRQSPSPGILLAYRDIFEMADRYDHWTTSAGDFADFLSARRRSVLTSQWDPDKRRLTISVNLLGARVPSLDEGAFPGVAVPRAYDNEEIDRVVVDDEPYPTREMTASGSGFERIIELPPGRHTVSVFYEQPPAEESPEDSQDESSNE